jgi:hypothetical protein
MELLQFAEIYGKPLEFFRLALDTGWHSWDFS